MPNIPDCCTVDCLNNGTNACVFNLDGMKIVSFICDDCRNKLEESIDKNNKYDVGISIHPLKTYLEELIHPRNNNKIKSQ